MVLTMSKVQSHHLEKPAYVYVRQLSVRKDDA